MKNYRVRVKDKIYDVRIVEENEDKIVVEVEGERITVMLQEEKTEKAQEIIKPEQEKPPVEKTVMPKTVPVQQQAPIAPSGKVIRTNVPGKIIKILKSVGEPVKTNETVLTMESMKMEIEIKSPFDGTIKKILVKPNDYVNPGTVLVELE